jgi:hypothetical protein
MAKDFPSERLDAIFNAVDELLLAGQFDLVDAMLTADPAKMPIVKMVGLLSISRAAEEHLPNYAAFYSRCRVEVFRRESDAERVERLFQGLEHWKPMSFLDGNDTTSA